MKIFLWMAAGGTLGLLFPMVLQAFEKPGDATGDFVILTVPAGVVLGAFGRVISAMVKR